VANRATIGEIGNIYLKLRDVANSKLMMPDFFQIIGFHLSTTSGFLWIQYMLSIFQIAVI